MDDHEKVRPLMSQESLFASDGLLSRDGHAAQKWSFVATGKSTYLRISTKPRRIICFLYRSLFMRSLHDRTKRSPPVLVRGRVVRWTSTICMQKKGTQ
jgi:hypothetical protein